MEDVIGTKNPKSKPKADVFRTMEERFDNCTQWTKRTDDEIYSFIYRPREGTCYLTLHVGMYWHCSAAFSSISNREEPAAVRYTALELGVLSTVVIKRVMSLDTRFCSVNRAGLGAKLLYYIR